MLPSNPLDPNQLTVENDIQKQLTVVTIPMKRPYGAMAKLAAKMLLTSNNCEQLKTMDKRTIKRLVQRIGNTNKETAAAVVDGLKDKGILHDLEYRDWNDTTLTWKS